MQTWPDIQDIFLQEWWWDAVCPPEKRLVLHLDDPKTGFWPLAGIPRLGIFRVYGMPPLTQHAGPWLEKREDFIRLLDKIPENRQLGFNLGFALTAEEVGAAEQKGMTVRQGRTYRIEDLSDMEKVYSGIDPAQRRQLRKAEKYLAPCTDASVEDLIGLQQETFSRRGLRSPYPPVLVRQLYEAVCRHHAGRLIALADEKGGIMACGLFVHDNKVCYSLTHGFRKTEKNIGAGSLLQWEGIKYAAKKKLVFDFEGSNIESIARFNSSFGAKPKTYTRIERYSTFFRLLQALRERLARLR